MSKYSYGLTDEGKITGFYFDNQLNNPLLTVTLHANTELSRFVEKENGSPETSLGRYGIYKKDSTTQVFNKDTDEVQDDQRSENFSFEDGWVMWGQGIEGECLSSILADEWNSRHPQDKIFHDTHLTSMAPDKNTKGPDGIDWSGAYGYTPIATAILNEDFQVNIQNTWTDVSGNNTLEDLWRTLQPMSGTLAGLAPLIGKISDNTSGETEATGILKGAAGTLSSFMAGASQFLNSSLVVQGSRFTIYQGTNTDFANLSMKFTLFSDWERVSDKGGQPQFKFMTVNQKLNRIWPYFQGYYQSLTPEYLKFLGSKFKLLKNQFIYLKNKNQIPSTNSEQEEKKEETTSESNENKDKDAFETAKEYIDKVIDLIKETGKDVAQNVLPKMIGFQDPPAGFNAINKNVDACQKGTFRLVFGGKYAIDNLVGGTMNVTFSKSVVKIPDVSSEDGLKFAPLSAEVVLNFKCASSFSNRVLSNILEGKGSMKEGDGDEQKQYRQLFDILKYLHEGHGHV